MASHNPSDCGLGKPYYTSGFMNCVLHLKLVLSHIGYDYCQQFQPVNHIREEMIAHRQTRNWRPQHLGNPFKDILY
jgi:hypothetical protein